MNMSVEGYTPEKFPISEIFSDLTESVRQNETEPLEAYWNFENTLVRRGLKRVLDYGSTSITSGGHARIPGADMGHIIQANTHTARELVTVLEASGAIQGNEMALPVDLGKTGWDQSQFMVFWSLVIGGPNLTGKNAPLFFSNFDKQIETSMEEHEVDSQIMANTSLGHETRRPEYVKFAHAFANLFKHRDIQPVRRFLSLVDPQLSLGAYTERVLATELDIDLFRVAAVKPTSVEEAVNLPKLKEDLKVIQAHGGEVIVAQKDSMLTIVRDPALMSIPR
jgi:hypothetical protein